MFRSTPSKSGVGQVVHVADETSGPGEECERLFRVFAMHVQLAGVQVRHRESINVPDSAACSAAASCSFRPET